MIIGYAVIEDSAHHAFLEGLRQRDGWCPHAQTALGGLRGKTRKSLRREIGEICLELNHKGADVMVFLRDANIEAWREVKSKESALVPQEYQHKAYGVADRNVECWLAAARDYLAQQLKMNPAELTVPDPSPIIKSRLRGISADIKPPIIPIVKNAPLWKWIENSESFESFYEDVRDLSQRLGCHIPNEREKGG